MRFSIIVPVFKRPDQIKDLLLSIQAQSLSDFEVLLMDGSPEAELSQVIQAHRAELNLTHFHKPGLPISEARNQGAEMAKGEFLIFLDSDVILPANYLDIVKEHLKDEKIDAYGGPDNSLPDFTPWQKAINYSMTSLLTTGGIRGKRRHVGKYLPRGFNMGIRKEAFQSVGGYDTSFKCAEDIEFSLRVMGKGYNTTLIEEAYVYHKRRTSPGKFFKQVFRFGAARINLFRKFRDQLKLVHAFPAVFSALFVAGIVLIWFNFPYLALGIALYLVFVGLHSALINKSLLVGLFSILSTLIQFFGYGYGFIKNAGVVYLLGKKEGVKL